MITDRMALEGHRLDRLDRERAAHEAHRAALALALAHRAEHPEPLDPGPFEP